MDILKLRNEVLNLAAPYFDKIDCIAEKNTEKLLRVMRESRVSAAHFNVSSGYAYDDIGRDKLDEVFARVFAAEKALVRTQFVSGTHALAAQIKPHGNEVGTPHGKLYKIENGQS